MVYADVLHQSGVSTELWHLTDFASNLLVLKLAPCYSVHKIKQRMSSVVSDDFSCDVRSLMVTLVMKRIHFTR